MNDISTNPILSRMRQPGPKKILSCDGGGIRGLISVVILARLEAELRQRQRRSGGAEGLARGAGIHHSL